MNIYSLYIYFYYNIFLLIYFYYKFHNVKAFCYCSFFPSDSTFWKFWKYLNQFAVLKDARTIAIITYYLAFRCFLKQNYGFLNVPTIYVRFFQLTLKVALKHLKFTWIKNYKHKLLMIRETKSWNILCSQYILKTKLHSFSLYSSLLFDIKIRCKWEIHTDKLKKPYTFQARWKSKKYSKFEFVYFQRMKLI